MLPECTRHPEGLALLQKCKESPDDFAHRLSLCQWLRTQGEELAADCVKASRTHDEFEFVGSLPAHWGPLRTIHDGWLGTEWMRVGHLAETCLLSSPWLGSVKLVVEGDAHQEIGRFVEASAKSKLIRLALKFDRHCSKLTTAIRLVSQAPQFENVEYLEIEGKLKDTDIAKIAGSKIFRSIKHLIIRSHSLINIESLKILSQSPILEKVTRLDFAIWPRDPEWISAIAESRYLRKLEKLILVDSRFFEKETEVDHRVLATSPIMENVRFLSLYHTNLNFKGSQAFANSPKLRNLQALVVDSSPIGDVGCTAIANSNCFQKLKALKLSDCDIGVEGAKSIGLSRSMPELEHLNLELNPIRDGLVDLLTSESLTKLKHLTIHRGEINDASIAKMEASNSNKQAVVTSPIEHLTLRDNHISEIGTELLIQNARFKQLKLLALHGNPINPESHQRLKDMAKSRNIRLQINSND